MTYVKWYMQNIKTISKQPNYILIIIFIIIFSNIKNNLVKVKPSYQLNTFILQTGHNQK